MMCLQVNNCSDRWMAWLLWDCAQCPIMIRVLLLTKSLSHAMEFCNVFFVLMRFVSTEYVSWCVRDVHVSWCVRDFSHCMRTI